MSANASIYWNLHKKCWSIQKRGQRVSHADSVTVVGVRFVVQQGGRTRVLHEQRKNVHAFVRGEIRPNATLRGELVEVSYNPYRNIDQPGSFYRRDSEEDVSAADAVIMSKDRKVFAINPK